MVSARVRVTIVKRITGMPPTLTNFTNVAVGKVVGDKLVSDSVVDAEEAITSKGDGAMVPNSLV